MTNEKRPAEADRRKGGDPMAKKTMLQLLFLEFGQ